MGRRDAGGVLGRRGLLAGAAALVAGGLAKLAGPGRAQAAHSTDIPYSSQTVLHVDQINTTSATTTIDTSAAPGFAVRRGVSTALPSTQHAMVGVTVGISTAGVFGQNDGTAGRGVSGRADGTNGRGVLGEAANSSGWGVFGLGGRYGVAGESQGSAGNDSGVRGVAYTGATNGVWGENSSSSPNATGVRGSVTSDTANPTVGVWGRSDSTGTGAIGTYGESTNGSGVRGQSGDGNGVFGVSTNASGVYGFSNFSYGTAGVSNSYTGVYARSGAHWGLHAESVSSFAAVFSGPVYINGSYTATGAKSAAVKRSDGSHSRMYCQESTEPWFEDFGKGQLAGGRATVRLDADFADIVKNDDYEVFPVPKGDCRGLYVANQTPASFEVRELQGGTSAVPFSYRVVAKRKDPVGRRLEKVDVPDFSKVKPLPTPPELPSRPEESTRPQERERPGR